MSTQIQYLLAPLFLLLPFLPVHAHAQITESPAIDYINEIKPIFDGRCVQCHSCYNSPCQLKLSSVDGIERGLVEGFKVYDNRRKRKAQTSRLGIDRNSVEEWRKFSKKHSFMPVVFNHKDHPEKNLSDSLIYNLIKHKSQNSELAIDDLNNYETEQAEKSRTCPDTPKKLKAHLEKRPNAGMPYGLPSLNQHQVKLIEDWTLNGSPMVKEKVALQQTEKRLKKNIETFLNQYKKDEDTASSLRKEIVSRYIYEHLFLAHIFLEDNESQTHFFRLVRTKDSCDSDSIVEIATRRPWDSAGKDFNYCLKNYTATLVHKTHITYKIDDEKIARWKDLFFSQSWQVKDDRSYTSWILSGFSRYRFPTKDKIANNPMAVFKDIPVEARYRFLLDDARYHVMTFIRGPVCKGNTAVNSIDEQFYVYFIDPQSDLMVLNKDFYDKAIKLQDLPARKGSEQITLPKSYLNGRKNRKLRNQYRELRAKVYRKEFPQGYSIDDIWNGDDGSNNNAALTVFRHFDSASVLQGTVGATPKTVFVLDYSILERLVYSLVTGFDVFSDMSHQVQTRVYMSYLKMEAEENFLSFFPSDVRIPMRKSWYTRVTDATTDKKLLNLLVRRGKSRLSKRFPLLNPNHPTQVSFPLFNSQAFYANDKSDAEKSLQQEQVLRNYRTAFVEKVSQVHEFDETSYKDVLNPTKPVTASSRKVKIQRIDDRESFEQELAKVTDLRALKSPWVLKMPALSYILFKDGARSHIYTLIRNKEHFNIAWISGEDGRRNQAADTMVAYRGIGGSYPNHIFVIDILDARDFLKQMIRIQSQEDYSQWIQKFGNPRSGPGSENFWENSDETHQAFKELYPIEYGAFDYNRYGIDYRYNDDSNEQDPFYNGLPKPLKKVFKLLEN